MLREEIQKEDLDNVLKWINNMRYFPSVIILNNKFVKFNYDNVVKLLSYPNNLIRIDFEPKFDPELLESEIPDKAYHIAPTQNEDKILRIGLAPKSKEKISKHPDRVYLSSSIDSIIEILSHHPTFKKYDSSTIFEVNIKDLLKVRFIRWFSDPNFKEGGFYTYENIPPKYLQVIKRISQISGTIS